MIHRFIVIVVSLLVVSSTTALAQQRSAKRGVSWDEKTQALSASVIGKMAPGVCWFYNWGVAPTGTADNLGLGDGKMAFLPMCWNDNFNETQLRNYLSQHQGETRYLLAFNEPNLSWNVGGAQMTPGQAATAWPKVKQIAADYGLEIVAPALNFTGDKVGDRVWEPFAWYDEFFRLVPDAGVDYLCFHSYMNYYSAVNWVTTEYFYTDKEESDLFYSTNRAKYPHLVQYLENYKEAHGHFPRMFLTEFCSYSGNEYPYKAAITRDFQIDQMTQKLQKLEKSDLVAGYAWFMGNIAQGANEWPYMSIFQSNTPTSELSELGKVYVYMSSFDQEKYYTPGEPILAKDYIDAAMDDQQPKVRPNTETGSDIPLQVQWGGSAWMSYQVDIATAGSYELTLHMQSTAAASMRLYRNATGAANKLMDTTALPSTGGSWTDVTIQVTLPAGKYALLLYNMSNTNVLLNQLQLNGTGSGIGHAPACSKGKEDGYYTLSGVAIKKPQRKGLYIYHGRKVVM